MRPPDGRTALYWACGGEVLALGGALPLAGPGGRRGGCRPLRAGEIEHLAAWHRAELAAAREGPVRDWHRRALRDANDAIANQSRLP